MRTGEVGLCCPAITEVTDPVEGQEGDTKDVSIVDVALKAHELQLSKVYIYLDCHKHSFDARHLNLATIMPLAKIVKYFNA